ncbi:MAG: hypothetical protein ACP5O6_04380 [Candidatus Baltobacteraceae bacterium]
MERAYAVELKIPDNEAYTAMRALQRLGVAVARVQRAEILVFDRGEGDEALGESIERDERLFNPNKHRLERLPVMRPRAGEVWIEMLDAPRSASMRRLVGWRLFDHAGQPLGTEDLDAACVRLLCNPAIERAIR